MDTVQKFHTQIRDLRDALKTQAQDANDPKGAALLETSGEVLGGLEEAFDHFLHKSEKAWQ